jgi:hypothetical protein
MVVAVHHRAWLCDDLPEHNNPKAVDEERKAELSNNPVAYGYR